MAMELMPGFESLVRVPWDSTEATLIKLGS